MLDPFTIIGGGLGPTTTTIQEADLVVDGETYGCVKSFCYLGDTLDGDGVANLVDTARIINEAFAISDIKNSPLEMKGSSMTYGSETRRNR